MLSRWLGRMKGRGTSGCLPISSKGVVRSSGQKLARLNALQPVVVCTPFCSLGWQMACMLQLCVRLSEVSRWASVLGEFEEGLDDRSRTKLMFAVSTSSLSSDKKRACVCGQGYNYANTRVVGGRPGSNARLQPSMITSEPPAPKAFS